MLRSVELDNRQVSTPHCSIMSHRVSHETSDLLQLLII